MEYQNDKLLSKCGPRTLGNPWDPLRGLKSINYFHHTTKVLFACSLCWRLHWGWKAIWGKIAGALAQSRHWHQITLLVIEFFFFNHHYSHMKKLVLLKNVVGEAGEMIDFINSWPLSIFSNILWWNGKYMFLEENHMCDWVASWTNYFFS